MEKIVNGGLQELGQYRSSLNAEGCSVLVPIAELDDRKVCLSTYDIEVQLVYEQGITDQEKEELFISAVEAELS
jgi:hypothetical protein